MSLHGLLLVHKPQGLTSHDVVGKVRRAFKMREVGHSGTLDPMATGLMVILLGEGTKLSDYILSGDKAYRVRVQLGIRTNTQDVTGEILNQQKVTLPTDQIVSEALNLQGSFLWPVPLYSAVKVEGQKLYEMARKNQAPQEVPVKDMQFWGVEVLNVGPDFVEVHLHCSKGSYIRSWAAELGERLGVGGAMAELERTESAPYRLEQAVSLSALEEMGLSAPEVEAWESAFIPLRGALPSWKTVTVGGRDERLILNGQVPLDLERRLIVEQRQATQIQKVVGIKVLSRDTGELLAILEAQPNRRLKIRRVFKIS